MNDDKLLKMKRDDDSSTARNCDEDKKGCDLLDIKCEQFLSVQKKKKKEIV